MSMSSDAKLLFPATARNREAIAATLEAQLVGRRRVLEIASGSGEHVTHFAAHFAKREPQLRWQPSDIEPEHLASVRAWTTELELGERVLEPVHLDVLEQPWPAQALAQLDTIFCANMIHIAPETAAPALLRGASEHLPSGGQLILYGPFTRNGVHTAESNQAFSERLQGRNPRWGVRDLESLAAHAQRERLGLGLTRVVQMPANNLVAVFERA